MFTYQRQSVSRNMETVRLTCRRSSEFILYKWLLVFIGPLQCRALHKAYKNSGLH